MSDDGSTPEVAIKSAIQKRAEYLVANLATCTMKQCRRLLEEDLDLPTKALDGYKNFVADEVDRVVRAHKKMAEQTADETQRRGLHAADARRSDSKVTKKRKVSTGDQPKTSKPVKKPFSKEHVSRPDKKLKRAVEVKAAPLGLLKKLEKLKAICANAGIKISPSLYKANKSDEERVVALRELLDKHGLNSKSARADCLIVKRRLEKERDLEGIDMGNVISGARRSRTANAAPVNYRAMYGEDSDEDAAEDGDLAPGAAGDGGSGAERSEGDVSDGAETSVSDEGRSGDENVQPLAVAKSVAKSPATGRAKKATPAAAKKTATPVRPAEKADEGACASTDESESGESAGQSAGEDGTDSAVENDGADGGSSSDEEAPVAGKQRAKTVAVLDSDDDSLDLD